MFSSTILGTNPAEKIDLISRYVIRIKVVLITYPDSFRSDEAKSLVQSTAQTKTAMHAYQSGKVGLERRLYMIILERKFWPQSLQISTISS